MNHEYLTVVLDLFTGAVVFVGEGKGRRLWDRFGNGCNAPVQKLRLWR